MTNKHRKKYSTLLIIRKLKTKTTMKWFLLMKNIFHEKNKIEKLTSFHPLEWLKLRRLPIPKIGKDMKQLGYPYIGGRNAK